MIRATLVERERASILLAVSAILGSACAADGPVALTTEHTCETAADRVPTPGSSAQPGRCGSERAALSAGAAADYPLFSPPAYYNRPISYWGLGVDAEATAFMNDFLVNDPRCSSTHPAVALGGYSIYWVHDGDDGLKEYSVVRRRPTDELFTCTIPGREPITTFRIPSNAVWSYPSDAGDHDHHLFIIDVSRNIVLSFYSFDDANMGELPDDPSRFVGEYVNCDPLHGEDAAILAAETSRWKAGPSWLEPEQNGGVGGIGTGFGWPEGVTNGGSSVGGAIMPEDFGVPGQDDLGHVLNCHVPPDLQNGMSWPATGADGPPTDWPAPVIRCGTLLRIDPTWSVPADTPEWEARILRTWQRYGCMIDDNGSWEGCMASRGQGAWTLPGGGNAWEGVIPAELLRPDNGEIWLGLAHFPADRVQVMNPIGPTYDRASQPVTTSRPPFILSHRGLLTVAPGGTAQLAVTATLVSGISEPVSFAVSGFPEGIDGAFAPTSCTPTESTACSVTLSATAAPSAAIAARDLELTGSTPGGETMTISLRLAVAPATEGADGAPCSSGDQCTAGVCDPADGRCGYANGGTSACSEGTASTVCRSDVCGVDGQCGFADGTGTCSATDAATVCRSGVCDGGVCGVRIDGGTRDDAPPAGDGGDGAASAANGGWGSCGCRYSGGRSSPSAPGLGALLLAAAWMLCGRRIGKRLPRGIGRTQR